MKYVVPIEDKIYLLWQIEIQICNFREHNILTDMCVVIFYRNEPSDYAKYIATLVDVKFFENDAPGQHYAAIYKAYGCMKLLQLYPHYGIRMCLLDPDVLFRTPVDFTAFDSDSAWYMSDCSNYINYDYVVSMITPDSLKNLCDSIQVNFDLVQRASMGGGAQYYFKNVTSAFFNKCVHDAILIYDYLKLEQAAGSKIQIWTAEMWALFWNALMQAEVRTHPSLNFAWASSPRSQYEQYQIIHFAGVTNELDLEGYFNKTRFTDIKPWNCDLSKTTKTDSGSYVYIEKMIQYREQLT